MKRQRFSLPSGRPIVGAESASLGSGWPLLVLLSLPPIVGYIWRGIIFGDWGWGIVGLAICGSLTYAVWHGLLARTTDCNSKVYSRYDRPVRYWLTLAFWFAWYLIAVAAFFFEHSQTSGPIHR